MRRLIAQWIHSGQRIDKIIRIEFPYLRSGYIDRAFRQKDIKANGVRVARSYVVQEGDRIEIYIADNILENLRHSNISGTVEEDIHGCLGLRDISMLQIIYNDANILVVNKRQGIPVHSNGNDREHTLIDLVKEYFGLEQCFLCHRIDRNTGGIVIIAKNRESLAYISSKMKSGEILKFYRCLVNGIMDKKSDTLAAYLTKDEYKSKVFISDIMDKCASKIITKYKVINQKTVNINGDLYDISELEIALVTGKTHQIRAHLAHIGHPIIGDGKYGINQLNRRFRLKYQQLLAYKIVFDFKKSGERLDYLSGRIFKIEPEFKILETC